MPAEEMMTVLAADHSLSGARWQAVISVRSEADTRRMAALFEDRLGFPFALCWHLASLGVEADALDAFLDPKLRTSLPDPSVMRDADRAINLITDIIKSKQPIGLFGDYDVDGACSAAMFRVILGAFGVPVWCHIPDRFTEGYGPNLAALKALKAQGAELILTVDCGITAHEPLAAAAEEGMRVIVIDHHKAGVTLPQAEAVVNPNRLDDDSGLGHLCAAGVCFLVLAGVVRACRVQGLTPEGGQMPDLMGVLDLVALATACDVVPLTGVNRAFIKQGLKVLARRGNEGLRALMDVARLEHPPTMHTLGFVLGPRLNAGGRLGRSDLGVQILTSTDSDIAETLALQIDQLNTDRRAEEAAVRAAAEQMAEDKLAANPDLPVLVLAQRGWHEGVIGIVAGRLKDAYHRPVVVIAIDEAGYGKGSARSVAGFSIGDQILAARQDGLLKTGGGHDMAAGLGLHEDQIDAFEAFVVGRARQLFSGVPQRVFSYTHSVSVAGCISGLVDGLEAVGPFGAGHAEPRFVLTHCRLKALRWIGKDKAHLSVQLDDGTAAPLRAVAFSVAGTALGQYLAATPDPGPVQVLGRVQKDSFRGGNAVQFLIEDIALSPV
ncbi:single-stranded-DNA-specific exonuclease RecJ [SAR116 cluster alpha proteobacterium HIMB100]|nr:single-stranded-DNA-specific exonuclease RecJ [SAR116 cluster alpha proteobacterium HIMB100]